jgi:hypothetical protein
MKPAIGPLALDYLGASLGQHDIAFSLLDLSFEPDAEAAIRRAADCERVDAVAVTVRNVDDCYFGSQDFVLARTKQLVRTLKEAFGAPVLCGGVGFSTNPVAALEFLGADYGVAGEGECALPAIVRSLSAGAEPAGVPGLVVPGMASEAVSLARASLDTLDLSRRDVIDNARYFRDGGQAGIETKRGCDGNCVYCADPVAKGREIRVRPPENVAQEAASLRRQGVTHWHTCDSEFNRPPEHALAVCAALTDAGLGESMRWYAYCSPASFSRELCAAMRRAGCVGINFGVDAGNAGMLRRLRRDHSVDDIRAALGWCRESRIAVMLDLLLGGPGETPETVRQTVALMKQLSPDRVGISLGIRVYAGTPLARWLSSPAGGETRVRLHSAHETRWPFLSPTFVLSEELGEAPFALVADEIADDPRFLFVAPDAEARDYNYNANDELVEAIQSGHRGAYWDILRRVQDGLPQA